VVFKFGGLKISRSAVELQKPQDARIREHLPFQEIALKLMFGTMKLRGKCCTHIASLNMSF
jgi:hypothetical protein